MAPEVDFYTTGDSRPGAAARLACKVVEKAYGQGLKVYVHADSPRLMRRFDDLLWTFQDGSFVPHECADAVSEPLAPVTIGCGTIPDGDATVLCNLGATVPDAVERFARLVDVADAVEPGHTQARERYRWYKQQGYTLRHHSV